MRPDALGWVALGWRAKWRASGSPSLHVTTDVLGDMSRLSRVEPEPSTGAKGGVTRIYAILGRGETRVCVNREFSTHS